MNDRRLVEIQFTRPNRWFQPLSWLIRKVQGTPYSHVRLAWNGVGGKVPVIYEASGRSLKFIGPIAAKNLNVKIVDSFKFNIDNNQYRSLVELCINYANVDYGKKQLIGIGLVHSFGLNHNPFADGRRSQVCSEVVGHFLEKILGWDLGVNLDIAGPKEIRDEIVKHRKLRKGI